MEKDKGYAKPANPEEEARIMNEIMADPEGKAAYDEYERIYAFKKAVVAARKSMNLTQNDVAIASGLTQQMVSKIETGDSYCNFASILKYLNVVDPSKKLLTV